MNKRLSAKDQKALLNAVAKARETQQKMAAKAEGKRWLEIEVPLALEGGLAGLTKNELTEIRTNLAVKGVSSMNKEQLAGVLEQQIPASLHELLHKFDETRFQVLKQIAARGGYTYSLIDNEQLAYFHGRGLIFSGKHKGKHALVIPQEVLQSFQSLDHKIFSESIRRNTEWIKLTHGMLFYYGHVRLHDLVSMIKQLTGLEVEMDEYVSIIQDSIPFYRKIRPSSSGFFNELMGINPVVQEQEFRLDLSFYPFTKSQLLQAGEPDFVDRNPSHRAFVDFIRKNYRISQEEADFIVEDCTDNIRLGHSPGYLLKELQQQLEIDDLLLTQGFMGHISELNNNTRQWLLKGYTPNELSPASAPALLMQQPPAKAEVIDFATRNKVGRNDPCPCGSGKKHKKCCGA
ncbi:YecA family protein [Paenibacillus sedimenti]|uniref:SEC-C domain-containing protein n=1 Tax=Paenibacillus sedimenti TaxID=2770274 RepID=A0A926QLU5_9BACL|nr:SEC-C metal-binding domain-containing protein [Paenibacillus sedimenti]MBD0383203.1 SEC-C domain-containing protein [Paenibacillus sedimenti]